MSLYKPHQDMKIPIALFGCLLGLCVTKCSSNRGRDFILAFMENYELSGRNEILISGETGTKVRIECINPYLNITQTVPSSGFLRVDIPITVRIEGAGLDSKGVHVTSDGDIAVHGNNAAYLSTDLFVAVPTNQDFTEFQIPSYTPYSASEFVVVGHNVETSVQVYRPDGRGNFLLYSNFSLNLMETSTFLSSTDFTAYKVISSKPISVYAGNRCANVPRSVGACDLLAVSVLPVSYLGLDFIIPPIYGRSTTAGYKIRIVANQDMDFTISNNNLLDSNSLRAGLFYEYDYSTTRSTLIVTCSKPCSVIQYNKGANADNSNSDPYMVNVLPQSKFTNALSWVTPTTSRNGLFNNYVSIISKCSEYSRVLLDGNLISSPWFPVPGATDFNFTTVSLNHGLHTLEIEGVNDPSQAFAAYAYGHTYGESYGSEVGYMMSTTLPPTMPPNSLTPVLDILVNGTYITADGSTLSQECSSIYASAMRNKNILMALQITGLLGNEICNSSFTGTELLTADVSFIGSAYGGIARTGIMLPGILTRTFGEMHNCGRQISTYLQNHDNWGRPILSQEPGCPALTFDPERFDHYDWIWRCIDL